MTSRITLPSIHCLLHATGLETNHHGYLPDLPPLSLHHDMPPRVPQQQHQQQHNDAYPSPPSTTHVGPLFTRPAIPKPEETVIPPQRRRASSFFSYNNEHIAVAFCTSSFPKQQHTDVSLTEATNAETQDDDETRDSDDSLLRRPSAQLSLTHHPRRKSSSASSSSCLDETKRDIADHVRQMQWHRTINLSDDLWHGFALFHV
ncbi:uncharacterized protein BYT42DRAFT_300841 [Radiomyces spectabilis]|uniref:uncharacterized protein n=1 Tax=Radiomyces spectabilis TaxID=64574 RepID=UPI002220EA72|nr:uncharacterized protein BYT42DRAFT_300841 [Radiomyces spectabilis]KAI8381306.1 hypothetical protein BYT42DRAFT_300841 [Radiomyces spectabilis]